MNENDQPQPQSQPESESIPSPQQPEHQPMQPESQPQLNGQPEQLVGPAFTEANPELQPIDPEAPVPQYQPGPQPAISSAVQPVVKKRNTKTIVGVIGAVVGVLLLVTAALLYFLWWQNPDRVVASAVSSYIQQGRGQIAGSLMVDSAQLKLAVEVDSRIDGAKEAYELRVTAEGSELPMDKLELSIDLISPDDGALYARLTEVDKIADAIIDVSMEQAMASPNGAQMSDEEVAAVRAQVEQMFAPIVQKVDNQWAKISLEGSSRQSEDSTCLVSVIQKLNTDKITQQEVAKIYSENKFLIVDEEVGNRNGSTGYRIDLRSDLVGERFESFVNALRESDFGKEVESCEGVELEDVVSTDEASTKDESLVLWVNKSSATLTGIDLDFTVDGEEDVKVQTKLDLNSDSKSGEEIVAPDNAQDIQELIQEIMIMMQGGSAAPAPVTQPQSLTPVNSLSI